MQNFKTHIVVAVRGSSKDDAVAETLYLGPDRAKAREIYLENRTNLDFDFVGMDTLNGFKSRARPKIDAANAQARAEALTRKTREEVEALAVKEEALAEATADAFLRAKAEREEAEARLRELARKGGASIEPDGDGAGEPEQSVDSPRRQSRRAKRREVTGNDGANSDDGDANPEETDSGEDGADALLK